MSSQIPTVPVLGDIRRMSNDPRPLRQAIQALMVCGEITAGCYFATGNQIYEAGALTCVM